MVWLSCFIFVEFVYLDFVIKAPLTTSLDNWRILNLSNNYNNYDENDNNDNKDNNKENKHNRNDKKKGRKQVMCILVVPFQWRWPVSPFLYWLMSLRSCKF